MTRKEIIIKAWMDLNIETPFGICDKTGWVHGYFCNGIDEILEGFGIKENQIDYDLDFNGVGKFRPISLKGIEDNNGWIKIESEDDLPNKDGLFYLTGFGEVGLGRFCELKKKFKTFNGNVYDGITHYQPIIKPDLPLY